MNALLEYPQALESNSSGQRVQPNPNGGLLHHVHGLSTMNSGRGSRPEHGPPDQSAPTPRSFAKRRFGDVREQFFRPAGPTAVW